MPFSLSRLLISLVVGQLLACESGGQDTTGRQHVLILLRQSSFEVNVGRGSRLAMCLAGPTA